jgi:hypothetical protein
MNNDVHYKSLRVREDGFSWRDSMYSFDDVISLYWFRKNTTVKMNFFKTHTLYDAWLKIFTQDGRKIEIHAHESDSIYAAVHEHICGTDTPKGACIHLREAYDVLANKTSPRRFNPYLSQLTEKRHFRYASVEFWDDGRIASGKKHFEISKCSVNRYPFCVTFSPSDKTQTGLLQRMWSGPTKIAVETTTDGDIFFALLLKVYGLRWDK